MAVARRVAQAKRVLLSILMDCFGTRVRLFYSFVVNIECRLDDDYNIIKSDRLHWDTNECCV